AARTTSAPAPASPAAPRGGADRTGGFGLALAPDRVAQGPQAVDLDLDDVARLEPDGGLAGHAHAGGGAGEDQVAGLEGEDPGEIGDDLVDPEDPFAGVRLLH